MFDSDGTTPGRVRARVCSQPRSALDQLLCRTEAEKQFEPLVNAGELARRHLAEDAPDAALGSARNVAVLPANHNGLPLCLVENRTQTKAIFGGSPGVQTQFAVLSPATR